MVRNLYKKLGPKNFFKKLIKIDPKCKKKIIYSDTQRVLRAYEVKKFTNKSIYDWAKNTQSDFQDFDIRKIYIDTPREKLLEKIYARTKKMINKNCLSEVSKFLRLNIDSSLSANKIIGIYEIKEYLIGNYSKNKVEELINIKTRQYAKRQSTLSRGHMKNWNKLYYNDFSILFKKILKLSS